MAHFGIEPWTPHDLRRTTGTRLGELGFNRLVQDKVLHHKDRTVGGIYDRHSYDGEKSRALAAWERRLRMIVLGIEESPT
jgi:integrase